MTEPEQPSFDIRRLGEVIAKALGILPGDNIELRRDKLDANRVLVIRHPQEATPGSSSGE